MGVAAAQPALPMMGDGAEMTTSAERKLGDSIVRELYRDPDYTDDAVLGEYVQSVLLALVQTAKARGEMPPDMQERYAWEILLGRDREVNAFALPGGYFGVYMGLIAVVGSRDELASVLAHELSHVTQRHIARLIAQQGKQTPLMLGALILGALAASHNPDAGMAMMVGGQALTMQNQLNFSRDMEREADRVGFGLMAPAGFSQQGFVSMFDKLEQANRLNDNGSWPYLRSHPLTTQRIADVRNRIAPDAPPLPPPTLEHMMMSARARVLMRPGSVDTWRQWAAEPQAPGFAARPAAQRVAAWYAAALSAVQLNDMDAARKAWRGLWADVRGDDAAMRQARLLGAELELAAGQPQAALARLDGAGTQKTDARPEMLLRAQALLRGAGNAAAIADALQTWVTTHPRDATVWQTLAQIWQQQKQPLRAVRADAEAYAAHFDYSAALDRFKAGQEMARRGGAGFDYIEASIIDTRLRAMQALVKEQAREAKDG